MFNASEQTTRQPNCFVVKLQVCCHLDLVMDDVDCGDNELWCFVMQNVLFLVSCTVLVFLVSSSRLKSTRFTKYTYYSTPLFWRRSRDGTSNSFQDGDSRVHAEGMKETKFGAY